MSLMNYISKYPYTDLSALNIDYWIKLIGEAAADIKALYAEDAAIRTEMAAFEKEVRDYLADQDIPAQVVAAVNDYLDSNLQDVLEESPALLNATDWTNRTVLFIGDSYLDGWDGSTTVTNYANVMNSLLHFKGFYKQSVGGAGFGYSCSQHFEALAETFVGAHTSAVLESITDIFILGGYNDHDKTASDIVDNEPYGIVYTCNYIKNHFPNARIYIGFIGRALYSSALDWSDLSTIVTAYKNGAVMANVNYLTYSELCMHDYRDFASDGVHPTENGYYRLGVKLAQILKNGDFDFTLNAAPINGITIDHTGTTFSNFISFYQILNRNEVRLISYGGILTISATDISGSGYLSSNWLKVGSFKVTSNRNIFMPNYDVIAHVPAMIQYDSTTKSAEVDCNIVFRSTGDIYLAFFGKGEGWSFATYEGVTKIALGDVSITLPIDMC